MLDTMNRTSSLFPLLLPLLLLLSSFCHSEVSSRVVYQVHVVPELSKVSGERVSVQGRLEVRAGTPSPEADLRVLLEEEGRHLHVLLHDALTVGNVLQLDLSEFVAGEVDPAVQLSELGAQLLQAEVTGVIVSETPKVMLVESLRVMDDGEAKRGGGWSDVGSYESEAFVGEAVHSVQFRPLVVLADFQDAQHACATGVGPSYGGAQGLMFDGTENVRDMFMEFSKNRTHLVRDTDYANTQIAGPYTLSYTTGTAGGACNNYAQQDADARALAAADGFNLTEFTSVVVVVPYDGDCGWAGFGTLAQCETDGVCSAHMLRCEPATWVHELGHNLYLRHSGEDKEDDETYPDSLDYYLDHSCAMGNYPDWMKLNAVKLYQTGWIDTAQVVETSTTVGAGTHIVSALDIKVGDATPYPQIVVFNDSSSKTYFLSARAKIGFSDSMRDDYVSGVQVHYQTTTPFSWIVTTLNDTTQTHTASNSGYTFRYDSRSTLNATFMLVPPGCDPDDTSGTTCEYDWKLGAWGNCDCGTDSQSRTVECADTQGTGSTVDDGFCVAANNFVKPNTSQTCDCGLCEGVTCDSPPTCHEQPHSCDPGTGVCSYTPSAAGSACGTGQDCDGAGNCVADVTAPTPTLSVSPSTDPSNAATVTLTVDFGETMVGFDVSDIGVGNGAASNLAGGTNGLYTATITPTTDGTVTIDIAAAAATDDASNDNIAATQLSYVYDGTPPTPALSISPSADPSNAATVTLTIDFGETVVGFELTDVVVGNGAASDLTGGTNGLYTATLTPTTDGTVTVDVAGSVATDSANNANDAATQLSYVYDGTPPTPALSISPSADPSNAATVTLTIDFGETVVGFELTDIVVGNGAASNLAGGTNGLYTATITPTTDGTVTVDIAGSVATDSANNVNDAATQLSYVYDATAPTPTMSITPSADPSNAVVVTLTVDFGESMIGFELSDVIVSSGFVAELGGGTSGLYTMKLSGERDGTVTVDIAGSVATDTAGNLNNAAAQLSFVVDRTKPAPSWVVDDSGATKVYTLTFNEAVTGLDINSFSAPPGASLSAFNTNSPTEVTVSATPANGDPFAITLLAGEATDSAGNTNDESGSPWVNFDCTVPSEAATTDTPLTLDVSGTGIAGNQLTIKFVQKSKYYNTQVGFESSTCSVDDFVWTEGHVNPATCEREWTGSAHWFDFVANCNLQRVVSPISTVDHIIYRANMYVDHNENIPGLRTGDPDIVRSIRSRLPFEVRMPTTVTATASQVRVFAPVVVEAAILEQGVTGSPGGAKTGSLYLLTSVQYPFKLTSSTGTTTPAGVAVSSGNPTRDTSVTDECLDNSANPCTQQWDWSFTPVNINVCELDGEYSVTFQLDCQASQAGDCPLDPNPGSVTLAFTIDTTNFCPLVVEELGVSASLDTYVSSSHNTIKHYFIDGQRIYALAPVNAAIAIESTTIVQASIVQPSGTEVFMLVDGNPTRTALGDDVDFQKVDGGAGAAGSNSLPSFNFVADSEAFGINLDLNEVITLKARIAITYANAGQSKRSEVIDVDLQYAPAQQQQRGNGAADVTAAFGMSPASTTASASTSPVAVAGFNAFVVAAGAFAAMVILVSLLTIQRGRAKIARLRVLAAKDGCSI